MQTCFLLPLNQRFASQGSSIRSPSTIEPALRKRSHHKQQPVQHNESAAPSPQLEKAGEAAKTQHDKNKTKCWAQADLYPGYSGPKVGWSPIDRSPRERGAPAVWEDRT